MLFRHSSAIALAFTFAFPAAALAATVDSDDVVVTASRFQSDDANRPVAAQIITADEIRDSSALTVSEVLQKIGGVHTRINFTGVPDAPLDLRGFGMTGDQNSLVLLNGQRISENEGAATRLSAIPLNSIERIEILRGSGSVLYGAGASGGTINIITRSPVAEGIHGNAMLLAGAHQRRDARAGIQAGNGRVGFNLNAQHFETDNYRENNRAEQDAINGELRLGIEDGFIAFNFSADDQKARLAGARTEAQLASDPQGTSTPNDFLNSRSQLYSLRGEKRLGEFTLAMDVEKRHRTSRMFSDFGFGFSSLANTDTDITMLSPRLLWKTRSALFENRLTVGADWSDWSYTNDTRSSFGNRSEVGTQENQALYLKDEVSFTSGTRLSAGIRRENIEQDQLERLTPLANISSDRQLSAHEISLQQALGAGFSAYGRIGRSFRVGNIDENRCWFAPCSLLKPQRSRDRELGVEWTGSGASFRAGLFQMDIQDEIHYNILTFSNMNLSPTRHRGLEIEGQMPIGQTLDMAAKYTLTEATFREGTYGGVNVTGNDVPMVPRNRLSVNLGWQAASNTRLTFNTTMVGSQHYDNDQANRFRQMPSYTVADIKLSQDLGAWRISGGVNNMFDKKYYSYGIVNGTFTSFNAYPEDRRNGYLSAEYRF